MSAVALRMQETADQPEADQQAAKAVASLVRIVSPPLPAPLLPAEVDLRGLHYMPLDVTRLLESDLYLTQSASVFRIAVTFWCRSWLQVPAGSLPNDDQILGQMSGEPRYWSRYKERALRGWVLCSDNRWYHPVVCEKAIKAWDERLQHRKAVEDTKERMRRMRGRNRPAADAEPDRDAHRSVTGRAQDAHRTRTGRAQDDHRSITEADGLNGHDSLAINDLPDIESAGVTRNENVTLRVRREGKGKERHNSVGDLFVKNLQSLVETPPSDVSVDSGKEGDNNPPPAIAYRPPPCPVKQLIDLYHEKLPELPGVLVVTSARRHLVQARWQYVCGEERFDAKQALDFFASYFDKIRRSKFLLGQRDPGKDGRAWKADFDWIFKEANFSRILEGGRYEL